jgi:hypothetical protein
MKKLIFIFTCFLMMTNAFGQNMKYNLEYGIRGGASNYLGDIGSGDLARGFVYNLELADTRVMAGAFLRWRFHPVFSYEAAFSYANIRGFDKNSINYARTGRNLSFNNNMFMLNNKLLYLPTQLHVSDIGRTGRYNNSFDAYIFAGVGFLYNNPKAEYGGVRYALRKLSTEGNDYSPVVVTIPMGAGFYFTHVTRKRKRHRFGFEMSWNLTFTDYLDDISTDYAQPAEMSSDPMASTLANRNPELGTYAVGQYPGPLNYGPANNSGLYENQRGDPNDKDNFLLVSLSYSYVIKTKGSFSRGFNTRTKSRKYGGARF